MKESGSHLGPESTSPVATELCAARVAGGRQVGHCHPYFCSYFFKILASFSVHLLVLHKINLILTKPLQVSHWVPQCLGRRAAFLTCTGFMAQAQFMWTIFVPAFTASADSLTSSLADPSKSSSCWSSLFFFAPADPCTYFVLAGPLIVTSCWTFYLLCSCWLPLLLLLLTLLLILLPLLLSLQFTSYSNLQRCVVLVFLGAIMLLLRLLLLKCFSCFCTCCYFSNLPGDLICYRAHIAWCLGHTGPREVNCICISIFLYICICVTFNFQVCTLCSLPHWAQPRPRKTPCC